MAQCGQTPHGEVRHQMVRHITRVSRLPPHLHTLYIHCWEHQSDLRFRLMFENWSWKFNLLCRMNDHGKSSRGCLSVDSANVECRRTYDWSERGLWNVVWGRRTGACRVCNAPCCGLIRQASAPERASNLSIDGRRDWGAVARGALHAATRRAHRGRE